MNVLAASIGLLAFAATLGLVTAKDTSIRLELGDDGAFAWTVDTKGKPQGLSGKWSLDADLLTLAQSGQGGALIGRVGWQAEDKWSFRVIGTGADDPGLTFTR